MRPGQTPSVPGNDRAAPNAAALANFNMILGLIGYAALSPGDTGASGLYIFLDLVIVGVLWASIGAKLAKLVVREGR